MACCEVLFGTVPPTTPPSEAQIPIYIDRTSKKVYYWNGTGWELTWEIQTAGVGTPGVVSIDPNSPIYVGDGGTLQINCERLKTQCGFATVQEVSEAVSSAINELVKSLNTSLQGLDSRITALNGKVSQVENSIGSLTSTVAQVENALSSLAGRVSAIEGWDICAKASSCGTPPGPGGGTQIGIVLVAEGGAAGQWQRVDGNFNPVNYPFGGAFFNSHHVYAGIVDQTIDGQAMMKVPKYYLKTGTVPSGTYAGKRYWMISDQPASGFAVHPAFMNYGAEVAQYWVGKYQGTNDGGTKLGSVAGVTPLVSIDFPTMQGRAAARNTGGVTGFGLWNFYQLSAIQTLALIEMGGSDSQTLIGKGNVNGSGALATDNATVAQATWRGIVGLWGNVWQMVDGLQTDASSRYKIWDKNGNKTYQTTSLTAPTDGYPVTMATATGTDYDLATVFAAETTNATAGNGTYGDHFWQRPGCVVYHGGWGHGANAGLFCLNAVNAASMSDPSVGGRLAKV